MSSPLSPMRSVDLNSSTPPPSDDSNGHGHGITSNNTTTKARLATAAAGGDHMDRGVEDENSRSKTASPADVVLAEPVTSPVEARPSSPLRPFRARLLSPGGTTEQSPVKRSPRKGNFPERRFPIKASVVPERPHAQEPPTPGEDVLPETPGLKKAIEIFEDHNNDDDDDYDDDDDDDNHHNHHRHAHLDTERTATMTSPDGAKAVTGMTDGDGDSDWDPNLTLRSNFSAIPDLTMFAKLGYSPSRKPDNAIHTPTSISDADQMPAAAKRRHDFEDTISPTPRRAVPRFDGGINNNNNNNTTTTTTNLMDFTGPLNGFSQPAHPSPARQERMSPNKNQDIMDLLAGTPSLSRARAGDATPRTRMSALLDFDIPPAPTPRSLPSITPRELETLKSNFMSEISSLKASLSGKEAEIQSLKTAVGDAEKRVGESMEQYREQKSLREELEAEREMWEKRGREMEAVLRNVQEEIVAGERERESLEGQLRECEQRREMAEMMAQEAESKLAGVKAGSAVADSPMKPATPTSTQREVEMAVEKVARELHTLYKGKHETKVAALKKSYENRWERKVKELEMRVVMLSRENEELQAARDAAVSSTAARSYTDEQYEDLKVQAALDARAAKELEARIKGLAQEIKTFKHDNDSLRQELQMERVEKGELVAAVEEMIALQSTLPSPAPAPAPAPAPTPAPVREAAPRSPPPADNFRRSIGRVSGLRAPNYASNSSAASESRIARPGHERTRSLQPPRPVSGVGMKSGIMSSIEKMGNYK